MKKRFFSVLILIIAVLLSSCTFSGLDSDALLTPPQMNAADREILSVIESISSSYKLVYPKYGNYQTAVTSVDLTGNGQNEAACFYLDGATNTVSFIILENSSGAWKLKGKADSRASEVERISFCDLNADGVKEAVIGWQFQSGEEKAIEIFGFGSDTEMKSLYTGMYNSFIAYDDAVVVISRNTSGKTASASLIGKSGNSVSILNTVSLNNSITSFISVQSGELGDSRRAVYIDEQLENLTYTTEVLTVQRTGELTVSPEVLSSHTVRSRAYKCTDINGDRRLDIPVEKNFPEYERGKTTEMLSYVEWYDYNGSDITLLTCAYTSINEQFMIELPHEWINNITVQRASDTERSVQFYRTEADGKLTPMFSVRVFSQQEYSDTLRGLGWKTITTSNENVYAYRGDSSELDAAFRTDIKTVSKLFSLLS